MTGAVQESEEEHSASQLRILVLKSLRSQGFLVRKGLIHHSGILSKDQVRELHKVAVEHRREQARKALSRIEPRLLARFARGRDIVPAKIDPVLVEVLPDSEDEKLFRYATLQWSIPISNGYGRRLRFLVIDQQNGKLLGVIGLADPVYSLKDRDAWIGWSKEAKRIRMRNVMDAFVLGAVQPYSQLLCGKLVAMLASSQDVTRAFQSKYGSSVSLISKTTTNGQLALITTLSALGKSSIYNRLSIDGRAIFEPVGYSNGSGEFHFSNGTYSAMLEFATKSCEGSAKNPLWGTGFRNRREVIRKCLQKLGLKEDLLYHGVRRQIFMVPLAGNTREYLRGDDRTLKPFNRSASYLAEFFQNRWLNPRLQQRVSYIHFEPADIALW